MQHYHATKELISHMQTTIAYYNQNATQFYNTTVSVDMTETLQKFTQTLPPQATHILDLGCGSGRDSLYFLNHGYQITAIDGSPELCKKAAKLISQPVICQRFEDINYGNQFDGIWACASLLHVQKSFLTTIFQNLTNALKPNGTIYASFKYGDFEGERAGRYFTDLTETTLASLIAPITNLELVQSFITADVRPGRQDERWLNVIMKRIS